MSKPVKDLLLVKPLKGSSATQTVPPLGLGFISSHLKKKGFHVDILDCNIEVVEPKQLPNFVDLKQYIAIGFQIFTIDMPMVKQYLDEIRKVNSDIVIIVGGVQPSSDPERTMQFLSQADLGVSGEGETTMTFVMDELRKGTDLSSDKWNDIPNLILRNGDNIILTDHFYEENLDLIGAPDWAALKPELYSGTAHGFYFRREPVMPIIVSRGCPFHCTFCGSRNITGYMVRFRSPDNVLEELIFLKKNYNLQEFQIIDDNFTAKKKIVLEFCRKLIDKHLDLIWTCPNGIRLDTLDKEIVEMMKKAGCYEVSVGIESGSQKILDDMKKNIKIETIKEKVHLLNSVGISVIGFVMVGYPTDTAETIEESMKFVLALPLRRISLTRFVPFPNTPVTDELIASGQFSQESVSFEKMTYDNFVFTPKGISDKTLKKLYRKFFFSFYMRPRIILHNLGAVRSSKHFLNLFKKARTFLR